MKQLYYFAGSEPKIIYHDDETNRCFLWRKNISKFSDIPLQQARQLALAFLKYAIVRQEVGYDCGIAQEITFEEFIKRLHDETVLECYNFHKIPNSLKQFYK